MEAFKIITTRECFCEHYLHEKTNYPREGLVEKRFEAGVVLTCREVWANFFGEYYRCKHEDGHADISVKNAKVIQ